MRESWKRKEIRIAAQPNVMPQPSNRFEPTRKKPKDSFSAFLRIYRLFVCCLHFFSASKNNCESIAMRLQKWQEYHLSHDVQRHSLPRPSKTASDSILVPLFDASKNLPFSPYTRERCAYTSITDTEITNECLDSDYNFIVICARVSGFPVSLYSLSVVRCRRRASFRKHIGFHVDSIYILHLAYSFRLPLQVLVFI